MCYYVFVRKSLALVIVSLSCRYRVVVVFEPRKVAICYCLCLLNKRTKLRKEIHIYKCIWINLQIFIIFVVQNNIFIVFAGYDLRDRNNFSNFAASFGTID